MRLSPSLMVAAFAVGALPAAAQQATDEPVGLPAVDANASAGLSTPAPVAAQLLPDTVPQGELNLRSEAFGGPRIPIKYSEYGAGISPPLSWDPGPPATESYVLIVEDPDTGGPVPFVHWIVYGMPAAMTDLGEGIAGDLTREDTGAIGLRQGQNSRGVIGYFGMQPPPGTPPHDYHFQLFALDTMLDADAGLRRGQLMDAMADHVLAADTFVVPFGVAEALAETPALGD